MHGFVAVIFVMSSMYALIRGRHSPFSKCSLPTTNCETQLMNSIAMVKARGEMVQPAVMPTSSC